MIVSRWYHIPTEPAHKILAQACLSTLLQLDEHIDKERLENYPLAFYAAWHWVDHARTGDVTSSKLDHMEPLFDPDKPYFSAWIWLYDINQAWRTPSTEDISRCPSVPEATPLYYSAAIGLHFASSGHGEGFEITRVLLECGANVNARNVFNTTPLETASKSGHDDIVQLMLKYDAK